VARRALARGRVVTRSSRPGTNWARLAPSDPTTIPFGNKALIASLILSNAGINEVVRRTRGLLHVTSDQSAAQEEQFGAMGMMIVSDLALAAGAASIPGPVTDANDDAWFVWVPFAQLCAVNLGASGVNSLPPGSPYHFDSKVMRRVPEGFGIAVMVENGGSANGIEAAVFLSLLSSRA